MHPWCRLEYFLVINKRPASNIQPHGKTDTTEIHDHQRNNAQRALNAHVWYHCTGSLPTTQENQWRVQRRCAIIWYSNNQSLFVIVFGQKQIVIFKFCQKLRLNFMRTRIWSWKHFLLTSRVQRRAPYMCRCARLLRLLRCILQRSATYTDFLNFCRTDGHCWASTFAAWHLNKRQYVDFGFVIEEKMGSERQCVYRRWLYTIPSRC